MGTLKTLTVVALLIPACPALAATQGGWKMEILDPGCKVSKKIGDKEVAFFFPKGGQPVIVLLRGFGGQVLWKLRSGKRFLVHVESDVANVAPWDVDTENSSTLNGIPVSFGDDFDAVLEKCEERWPDTTR